MKKSGRFSKIFRFGFIKIANDLRFDGLHNVRKCDGTTDLFLAIFTFNDA